MQAFIKQMEAKCAQNVCAASSRTSAKPVATPPKQVEADVRKGDATMAEAESAGRGSKRAADESSASTQKNCAKAAAKQGNAGPRVPNGCWKPITRGRSRSPASPRASPKANSDQRRTCRTCGGGALPLPAPWCKCKQPEWYDRRVHSQDRRLAGKN